MATSYGPFRVKNNLSAVETHLSATHGIQFLEDPNEIDWYDFLKTLNDGSLKIVFGEDKVICSAGYDPTTLFPKQRYVAEVDFVPEAFTLPPAPGRWLYEDGAIKESLSLKMLTIEQERSKKIAEASHLIGIIKDAIDLGRATEIQKKYLLALQHWRIDLYEMDLSNPYNIQWPEKPEQNISKNSLTICSDTWLQEIK